MKKILCLTILITLFVLLNTSVHAAIPAPFDKIKEYALSAPPNEDGIHIIKFSYNEGGEIIDFILAYNPNYGIIGIYSSIDQFACEYWEKEGEITVWAFGMRYSIEPQHRADFFEAAFKMMRCLVVRQLI